MRERVRESNTERVRHIESDREREERERETEKEKEREINRE
jgi:hypothetical protein